MTGEIHATNERAAEESAGGSATGSWAESTVAIRDLTKRYGDVEALSDVTVTINRGDVTGLLGANGAGKTTLLKSILGLIIPTEGTVTVCGDDVFDTPASANGRVAAVFEGARNVYWRLTAKENVSLFARLHGMPPDARARCVDRALESVGLGDGSDAPVGTFSHGMKQRCALACALVRDAPVVILDEPTTGLDFDAREDLIDVVGRLAAGERRTVLLSSHDMGLVGRICDRAVVIEDGRVVADGTVDELRTAFTTRTRSVTVRGAIDPADVPAVTRAFETADWRTERGRTTFDVVLPARADMYALVDRLRQAEVPLLSIESAEPDIGSIFASITGDGSAEVDG